MRRRSPVVSHPDGSLGHFTAHVLLAPEDGLEVPVVSNASSFLAGHEAQYDIGLDLIHLLLGDKPVFAEPSLLMKMVVPVVAWLVVAALVGAFIRYLVRVRVQAAPAAAGRGARQSVRAVVPTVALLAVGGGLLAAPLGLAHHFHPDGGWAATVAAWTAVTWSAVRLAVGIASGVRTRRSAPIPNAAARADGRTPERATAGT